MLRKALFVIAVLLMATPVFSTNQFIVGTPTVSHDTMFVPVQAERSNDSLLAFEFISTYPEALTFIGANWDGSIVEKWPYHIVGTDPAFAEHHVAVIMALWANGIPEQTGTMLDAGKGQAFIMIFKINSSCDNPSFDYTVFDRSDGLRHMAMYVFEKADSTQYSEYVNVIRGDFTGVNDNTNALPKSFAVMQNYPNPFNPATQIKFDLPVRTHVNLQVINILGQVVTTLVNDDRAAGSYTVSWNASNNASGVYFYRLTTTAGYSETKKMMLVK